MSNILPITVFGLLLVPGVSGAAALVPSPPGAAIQFAPCFQTAEQRSATIRNIKRALRDPETGQSPDVRSVCSHEDWIQGRETLGVWLSPLPPAGDLLGQNNARLLVDAERSRGLADVDLLQPDDDFGWSLNAAFIDTLRGRVWAALPKRLDDQGREDTEGSVHLQRLTVRLVEPDTVRTTVNGFYDLGPNADFRLRVTDTITNVGGKLTVDTDDDLHVDNSAYQWLAGIFTVLLPPLGLHVFDAIDQAMMHLSMPDTGQSLGALIVQFAPNQFMIDNGQKINFTHRRFLVTETGVTGGGIARLEGRDPSVTIRGPLTPSVVSRTVTFRYTALPVDLRATANEPLQVSWFIDGALVTEGSSTQVDIPFEIPRNVAIGGVSEHRVRVRITDVDGLTAARTITVRISYEPNGPPVCREKPYLPQCGPPRDGR
jgi:hypothetical protein